MIRGTELVPAPAFGHYARPVSLFAMGDIEEKKLEIQDRATARAMDFLIQSNQSDRQQRLQEMTLKASQEASERAQEGQFAILAAGAAEQQVLLKRLTTLAVVGIVGFATLKLFKRATKDGKEAA